jgi:hypothetical protein
MYLQRGSIACSIRATIEVTPTLAELGLPLAGRVCAAPQRPHPDSGLHRTGEDHDARGVGRPQQHQKSQHNHHRGADRIPARHKLSNVNQREVGVDTDSFQEGLKRVRSLIREGKTHLIRTLLQQGTDDFQPLDAMPAQLCRDGRISQEEGLKHCDNSSFFHEAMARGQRGQAVPCPGGSAIVPKPALLRWQRRGESCIRPPLNKVGRRGQRKRGEHKVRPGGICAHMPTASLCT